MNLPQHLEFMHSHIFELEVVFPNVSVMERINVRNKMEYAPFSSLPFSDDQSNSSLCLILCSPNRPSLPPFKAPCNPIYTKEEKPSYQLIVQSMGNPNKGFATQRSLNVHFQSTHHSQHSISFIIDFVSLLLKDPFCLTIEVISGIRIRTCLGSPNWPANQSPRIS